VNQTFSRYIELGADHLARVSHGYSATPP
jgi:hypothetical protein